VLTGPARHVQASLHAVLAVLDLPVAQAAVAEQQLDCFARVRAVLAESTA
jgi:hypothetical protein